MIAKLIADLPNVTPPPATPRSAPGPALGGDDLAGVPRPGLGIGRQASRDAPGGEHVGVERRPLGGDAVPPQLRQEPLGGGEPFRGGVGQLVRVGEQRPQAGPVGLPVLDDPDRAEVVTGLRGHHAGSPPLRAGSGGFVRGSARQARIASSVNHTVRLPRGRRAASYAAQLVTRCRCLGMRWRRAALASNGTAGIRRSGDGPLPYGSVQQGDAPKEMDRLGLAECFTKRELADTMKALLTGGFIRANEPVGWSSNRNQLRGPRRGGAGPPPSPRGL